MAKKDDEDDEPEKYVGRTVRKFFSGFGIFGGQVASFDDTSRFFKVKYDDEDEEDVDLEELKEILVPKRPSRPSSAMASKPESSRGRKRRRRDLLGRQVADQAGKSAGAEDSEEDKMLETNSMWVKAEVSSPPTLRGGSSSKAPSRQLLGHNNIHEQDYERKSDPAARITRANFDMSGSPSAPLCGPSIQRRPNRTRGSDKPDLVELRSTLSPERTLVRSTEDSCSGQISSMVDNQVEGSGKTDVHMKSEEIDLNLPYEKMLPGEETEEKDVAGRHTNGSGEQGADIRHEMPRVLALMPFLPPSSKNLQDFDHCIAELFQVYSVLRSFSTVIFLSPFSLEEFAHALRSEDASPITDSVHLSLLQTLRRQLERLSKSGSKSATFTLRLLDWSLLDQITWPSFLMGYLLTQGFKFDRRQSPLKLDLMNIEYYYLSVERKLSILSFLCNKVLATDEARAEIARRTILEQDPEVMDSKGYLQKMLSGSSFELQVIETDGVGDDGLQQGNAVSLQAGLQETSLPSVTNYIRVGRHLDEDGNLDECVLCAMDGNLICCDGCPAAYHSRCVGVSRQALPSGDWFCPECRADKSDQRGARIPKGVRGGELLGIGPGSQLLFDVCGYLLISESDSHESAKHRWYTTRDLPNLLTCLNRAGPAYTDFCAVIRQLCGEASPQFFSPPGKTPILKEMQVPHSQQFGEVDKSGPAVDFSISDPTSRLGSGCSPECLAGGETLVMSRFDGRLQEDELKPVVQQSRSGKGEIQDLTAGRLSNDKCPRTEFFNFEGSENLGRGEAVCSPSQKLDQSRDRDHIQQLTAAVPTTIQEDALLAGGELKSSNTSQLVRKTRVASTSEQTGALDLRRTEAQRIVGQDILRSGAGCPANASLTTPISAHVMSEQVSQQPAKGSDGRNDKSKRWLEREGEISSAWIHTNAAAYVNKYSNCDFVATAALNLAAMAGGVDDLVDDRSGTLKRAKPSSVSDQLKAFAQASGHFFWPTTKKRSKELSREKCGWCIHCRGTSRRGCLLTHVVGQMTGGASLVVGGIRATKGGFGHHTVVVAYILHIEENLRGLLIGPWESHGHSKMWRKQIEQARSVQEVKFFLLQMEANLRGVALIADWYKLEDDAPEAIANSTTLTSVSTLQLNKKHSIRKRGRVSFVNKVSGAASYDGACFGVDWWRGGRVSRLVYNWESISYPAIRRAARQGGFREIPDLVYSRGLDLPRRTRQSAWRTRLGKVKNIGQLAVEVRFLDTFIKWHDIISPAEAATTHILKGSSEGDKAVKKAEILAKSEENDIVKYLLGSLKVGTASNGISGKEDAGGKAGNPTNKKQAQANLSAGATAEECPDEEMWVPETEVPLYLLKDYEEKMRTINHSKLASVKKGKRKSNVANLWPERHMGQTAQVKKRSFWNLLCNSSLPGLQESKSKQLSGWICGFCSKTGVESQYFKCQKCSGEFHRDCAQINDAVCKTCNTLRQGQRMRKPSYKMLDMKWQLAPAAYGKDAGTPPRPDTFSKSGGKPRPRKGKAVASPAFLPEQEGPSGRNLMRKKHVVRADSFGSDDQIGSRSDSPSDSAFESATQSAEIETRKSAKRKNKEIVTVVPSHHPRVELRKSKRGTAQRGIRKDARDEESDDESGDELEPQRKRGRKKKIVNLIPGEFQDAPGSSGPSSRKRPRGRPSKTGYNPKGVVSPPTVLCLPAESSRALMARDPDQAHEGPMLTRRKTAQLRESLSPSGVVRAKDKELQSEAEIHSGGKRTRLKIIFAGQEVSSRNASRSAGGGGGEEDSTRRSVHGLDFGRKSARSEVDIQKFREEKLILADQVLSDEENGPTCTLCSEYIPGYVYVCCDHCNDWFHGDAVGVKSEDAEFLVGFKCHKCRKCRTPSCPIVRNVEIGVELGSKTKKRGSLDDGEVIDSENLNSAMHLDSGSSSLQSSYSNSPAEKEFSAFDDAKAFPDFVAATNQAEEALAADGSNFGQSILTGDFGMSDLGLSDSHLELNALSLGDPHGNVWANNGSVVPLDLPAFSTSRADISSRTAPLLSFTELLASDDDYFEGVAETGPELNAVWPGGVSGLGDPPKTQFKSSAPDNATLTGLDKHSLPVSSAHLASSSQARSSNSAVAAAAAAASAASGSCTEVRSAPIVRQERAPSG